MIYRILVKKRRICLNIKEIDIRNTLSLEDYYETDTHWKQENLQNVVNTIQSNMNLDNNSANYVINNMGDFYGAYYGQLSSNVKPDTLYTVTNETLDKSTT